MPVTLDADSLAIAAKRLARIDPVLAKVHQQHGPPPLWKRPANLASLIRIILEQQVSIAAAKGTFDRLKSACGGRVSAERIRSLGQAGLRELGFSRQKARYTDVLVENVLARKFRVGQLRHMEDHEVRKQITSQLGLGDWSADVFLLLALCRPDIFPVGDLAIVKGVEYLEQQSYPETQNLLDRAEAWRPYRSVAARMIWQSYVIRKNRVFDP